MEELNTGNASTRVTPAARFGVNLMPPTWAGRPPIAGAALKAHRARLLDRMHQAGMDHVMVGDHVMFQDGVGNDGLTDAASVATATDELGVYLAVYLMVLRHPVLVARQILTVAQFAPGRRLAWHLDHRRPVRRSDRHRRAARRSRRPIRRRVAPRHDLLVRLRR